MTVNISSLYARDYCLWLEDTIERLKQQQFDDVDWENLLEELDSMGRSERQAVESLLIVLIVHLLKITYWQSERERNARRWIIEIGTFRSQIKKRLANSPSLKPYVSDIFTLFYREARAIVLRANIVDVDAIPELPEFTLAQCLDLDWLPIEPLG